MVGYIALCLSSDHWLYVGTCTCKCDNVHSCMDMCMCSSAHNCGCMVDGGMLWLWKFEFVTAILKYRGLFIPQVGGGSFHIPSA